MNGQFPIRDQLRKQFEIGRLKTEYCNKLLDLARWYCDSLEKILKDDTLSVCPPTPTDIPPSLTEVG